MPFSHLNLRGKDLVLELINRDNQAFLPRPLTFADVSFSEPTAVESISGGRNTKLTVTALTGAAFLGNKELKYWRLDLGTLFKEEYRQVGLLSPIETTEELIEILNQRFGLFLSSDDVELDVIDMLNPPVEYTLTAKPGSYAFVGEVTLTLTADIEDIIEANILDGFAYPSNPLIQE